MINLKEIFDKNIMEENVMNNEINKFVEENDRFIMKPEDINFIQSNNITEQTISDKLSVGSIVVLKITEQVVRIEKVDVEFNNQIIADYAGTLVDGSVEGMLLFNQGRILKIYQDNNIEKKTR